MAADLAELGGIEGIAHSRTRKNANPDQEAGLAADQHEDRPCQDGPHSLVASMSVLPATTGARRWGADRAITTRSPAELAAAVLSAARPVHRRARRLGERRGRRGRSRVDLQKTETGNVEEYGRTEQTVRRDVVARGHLLRVDCPVLTAVAREVPVRDVPGGGRELREARIQSFAARRAAEPDSR